MDAARPLLLGIITQFEFIAVLVIVQMILGYTRGLTVKLQSDDCDLVKASFDILLLQQTLASIRTNLDFHYDNWYEKVLNIANELEVTESIKRRCSIQIHCKNYVADGPKEYYERAVAIPFLDHLTQEINTRFSTNNLVTYCGFSIMPSVLLFDEGTVMVGNEPQ